MKVTADMKVKDVLEINERMLDAFTWLAPQFERLRNPGLRKVMTNRVTVEQAARIAKVPLTESLYVLNIVAGVEARELHSGMHELPVEAFQFHPDNAPRRPREIAGLREGDERVRFVDVMPHACREEDPLPTIMRNMLSLRSEDEVLLVRHPFDPIPLRDLFARRGFASWAEERRPDEWYIYFYCPSARAAAVAHPSLPSATYARTLALGASA